MIGTIYYFLFFLIFTGTW